MPPFLFRILSIIHKSFRLLPHTNKMIVLLGILANLSFFAAGFFRLSKHSMICAILGNFMFIGYYLLLGLHTPIISVSIGVISNLILIKNISQVNITKTAIISALIITFIIIGNFSTSYELLLIITSWAICLAQIGKNNYIVYKSFVLISQCLWISYCVHFNDYAMMTTCIFVFSSNLYSLTRNMHRDGLLTSLNFKYINN